MAPTLLWMERSTHPNVVPTLPLGHAKEGVPGRLGVQGRMHDPACTPELARNLSSQEPPQPSPPSRPLHSSEASTKQWRYSCARYVPQSAGDGHAPHSSSCQYTNTLRRAPQASGSHSARTSMSSQVWNTQAWSSSASFVRWHASRVRSPGEMQLEDRYSQAMPAAPHDWSQANHVRATPRSLATHAYARRVWTALGSSTLPDPEYEADTAGMTPSIGLLAHRPTPVVSRPLRRLPLPATTDGGRTHPNHTSRARSFLVWRTGLGRTIDRQTTFRPSSAHSRARLHSAGPWSRCGTCAIAHRTLGRLAARTWWSNVPYRHHTGRGSPIGFGRSRSFHTACIGRTGSVLGETQGRTEVS